MFASFVIILLSVRIYICKSCGSFLLLCARESGFFNFVFKERKNKSIVFFYRCFGSDNFVLLHLMTSSNETDILSRRSASHGILLSTNISGSELEFFDCLMSGYFHFGIDVPSLAIPQHPTLDNIMAAELQTLKVLSEPIIEKYFFIGNFLTNPMVFRWGNNVDYYRMDTVIGFSDGEGVRDALRIVQMSLTAVIGKGFTLADFIIVGSVNPKVLTLAVPQHTKFMAQDGRALYIPQVDAFLLVYTIPHPSHMVMPGISLMRHEDDGRVNFGPSMRLRPPEWPSFSGREKNWSPFLYNNTVYFIKSINPLIIVGTHGLGSLLINITNFTTMNDADEKIGSTYVVSASLYLPAIDFGHGSLRGGTPAQLINDSFYLSFFHTQTRLIGSAFSTYFMGCYTFSATPPFTMRKISRFPIVDERFYTGPWNTRFKNRKIDYVVFPMNFIIEGDMVYLSLGYQDMQGWVITLNLQKLLTTMRDFES